MNPIMQVQHNLLSRMDSIKSQSDTAPIKPAQLFESHVPQASFATAFTDIIKAVDNQQHHAAALAAAVDSGKSDDLVGAMIESQKASVSFSALLQVRNKLTSAFEEIMRTPL